jgi:hypothetical protein
MKSSQAFKKESSELEQETNFEIIGSGKEPNRSPKTHIKVAKPRPNGTDSAARGPRDCFPLG